MFFTIYDVMVVVAVIILSVQGCTKALPLIFKKKEGKKTYVNWIKDNLETMFIFKSEKRIKLYILGSIHFTAMFLFTIGFFFHYKFGIAMFMVGLVIGFWLPKILVNVMKKKRVKKFNLQMVDGLTLLSNTLKAGLSIQQGLQQVVQQMPKPISEEFNLILSEQKLGSSMEEAFINLGKRIQCEDVDMFTTAVIILKETGGNLSETFDTIVNTIRERIKVQQKISALVSQGIMQAVIIFCMPIVLGVVFYIIDPEYMLPMFQTWLGFGLLMVMFALQTVGGLVMWKIVKIDV